MHVSKKLIAVAVALVAIAAGTTAYAAVPDGGGVIHGCYDKNSGQLRIADTDTNTPKSCTSKEAAVAWNQQGPAGPAGPSGITGLHQLTEASPLWTTSGLHELYKYCPAGERALGAGYLLYQSDYPYNPDTGSAAAKLESFGSFNPPNGGYASVAITLDASKLPAGQGVDVVLYLTCATVS
jgi:hypothetical protein